MAWPGRLPAKNAAPETISRIRIAVLLALLALVVTWTAGARAPATECENRHLDVERCDDHRGRVGR